MEKTKSYCEAIIAMEITNVHRIYHDQFYGFPIGDDNELFGRLILEINQAGLSWTTILYLAPFENVRCRIKKSKHLWKTTS